MAGAFRERGIHAWPTGSRVGSICFLANVAAGHGALDLGIGDGLLALETGLRAMHLGYSNIGDYAREELGLNASTAVKKARLARRLRERPLVREAVRKGEITPGKAEMERITCTSLRTRISNGTRSRWSARRGNGRSSPPWTP